MQIYINKNGQQLGPFEESVVLQMLKNGQLSPNDLGFKQGQQQWQKLEVMFPTPAPAWTPPSLPNNQPQPQFNTRVQITPPKSGSSKGILFGLLGCGGLILIGIIGLVAFLAISKRSNTVSSINSNIKANSNSSSNSSTTASSEKDYKPLMNKAEELYKMTPPQKIATNPIIKGKLAIVEKSYEAKIVGIDYTGKELRQTDLDSYGFSTSRLATTPEEIETLIQIGCNKGNRLGTYEGNIPAFANVCKVTVIDYKTPAIITQKTFTNSTPPKAIKTSKGTSEYVLRPPDEMDEYISSLPLEKLSTPLAELPFDSQNGTYGKYTAFKNLAGELARISFPENIQPNAAIKGKFAVVWLEASGRAEMKGFDPFGKEIYKYDYEGWGVGSDRIAEKVGEIETLIRVICRKGNKLGAVERTPVFANKCEVSIIDYKNSIIISKRPFENKEMEREVDTELYTAQYIVIPPVTEIANYIKGIPK